MNLINGVNDILKLLDPSSSPALGKDAEKPPLLSPPSPKPGDLNFFDLIADSKRLFGFSNLDRSNPEKPDPEATTQSQTDLIPTPAKTHENHYVKQLLELSQGFVESLSTPSEIQNSVVEIFEEFKTKTDGVVKESLKSISETTDDLSKMTSEKVAILSELFLDKKLTKSKDENPNKLKPSHSLISQRSENTNSSFVDSEYKDSIVVSESASVKSFLLKFVSKVLSFFKVENESNSDPDGSLHSSSIKSRTSIDTTKSQKSISVKSFASNISNFAIFNYGATLFNGIASLLTAPVKWTYSSLLSFKDDDNMEGKKLKIKTNSQSKITSRPAPDVKKSSDGRVRWLTFRGWIGDYERKKDIPIVAPNLGTLDDWSASLACKINNFGDSISGLGKWSSQKASNAYEYFSQSETTSSPSTYSSLSSGSRDLLSYASIVLKSAGKSAGSGLKSAGKSAGSGLKRVGSSLKEGAIGAGEYLGDNFQKMTNSSSSSSYSSSSYSQTYRIRESLSNVDLSGARRSASSFFSGVAAKVSNVDFLDRAKRAGSWAGDIASNGCKDAKSFIGTQRTTCRSIDISGKARDSWRSLVKGVRNIKIGASIRFD
jgi:hypothetical protein